MLKRVVAVLIISLFLISCKNDVTTDTLIVDSININNQNENSSNTDNIGETNIFQKMIEDNYSIDEIKFADADSFVGMDYILLTKNKREYFTASDAWYEYALLGGVYDSYERGKLIYDEINTFIIGGIFSKDVWGVSSEYGEGFVKQFYQPHIIAFSADGKRVLIKEYIEPFSNERVNYRIYEGLECIYDYDYYEIVDRTQANYSTNLKYISELRDRSYYKNIREDAGFLLSGIYYEYPITDIRDIMYYKYVLAEEGEMHIEVRNILEDTLFFKTEKLDMYPSAVQILDNKLILGFGNQTSDLTEKSDDDTFNYLNYFVLDMSNGNINYLFTKPEGTFSPDLKYFAYSSSYTPDNGTRFFDKGYYVYEVASKETIFYKSQTRDTEEDYYVELDVVTDIICWVNRSELENYIVN